MTSWSGIYRKAIISFSTAFNLAGGAVFLESWKETGKVTSAATRGVIYGLVTGGVTAAATAYVPNDPSPTAPDQEVSPSPPTPTPTATGPTPTPRTGTSSITPARRLPT